MNVALDQLVDARERGLIVLSDQAQDAWVRISVDGPDAAQFLHSQTTNDVIGLAVGQGHVGARVTRTGHVVSLFSCHRRAETLFELLVQRSDAKALFHALDSMHFSEKLNMNIVDDAATVVQGAQASSWMAQLGGEWASQDWVNLGEGAVVTLGAAIVVRRSLTGDPGYLIWNAPIDVAESLGRHSVVSGETAEACLEALRLEAGWPRIGPDTVQKRLLPETGLEQHVVSYTKGCYLGQEVIARVRTYGSLPKAMRVLVVDVGRKGPQHTLEQIPDPGEAVVLADGSEVGRFGSRALSAIHKQPIAFAFLSKNVRTPGQRITIWGKRGPMSAQVHVAPLYTAADRQGQVASLYDRAIRVFAEGNEQQAVQLLTQALQIDPSFADGYEAIGVLYGRQGQFHEAIDFFRRLEEVAPHEPMVNTNLSLYYMKLGDKETAETQSALAAQKSMRKSSQGDNPADVAEAQRKARQADAQRKKGMFEQVLEFDPVDPIALFGLGRALTVLGDWSEAVDVLSRARDVDKRNSAVFLALGKALEAEQRTSEAMDVYAAGIEVASKRGDLMPLKEMEHRALLLKATGGYSGAE